MDERTRLQEAHFKVEGFPWPLYALWDENGRLLRLSFGGERPALGPLERHLGPWDLQPAPASLVSGLQGLLEAYFVRRTRELPYPLRPLGTPFERQVWRALLQVPYGETRTYAWLARQIGRPRAARAVGQALGKNPLPLFFPCHRIVAVKGRGGFSGGLAIKEFLLRLEGGGPFPASRI